MSEFEKTTINKLLQSVESLSSQIKATKIVTDIGLSNESKISKTEEEAIDRASYEDYMKTSQIDPGSMDKAINNIGKNLLDDLLDRNF